MYNIFIQIIKKKQGIAKIVFESMGIDDMNGPQYVDSVSACILLSANWLTRVLCVVVCVLSFHLNDACNRSGFVAWSAWLAILFK